MKPDFDHKTIEALNSYIQELYAPEDDVLRGVYDEALRQGMPTYSIRPEEGRMLQFLVALTGAKTIVELGTLAGYSGTWLARALPADGKLYTLDISSKHAEVAGAIFEKAGLTDRIEQLVGDGHESLEALSAKGPFDMMFIDAEKSGYVAYLEWGLANIRPGGLILAHNAFFNGQVVDDTKYAENENVRGMRDFNQAIAENNRLVSTIIPVGDGIAAAVVKE